jgi:hypothetical protein
MEISAYRYTAQAQYDAVGRITRATDALNNWRDFKYAPQVKGPMVQIPLGDAPQVKGPMAQIPLWDDTSKLNVTSISRTGDVNGDGSVTKTSPTMVYDTYGRATTSLTPAWFSCHSSA